MGTLCSGENNYTMAATQDSNGKKTARQAKIDLLIDYSKDIGLKMNPKNEIKGLTHDIKSDLAKLEAFYPNFYDPLVKRNMHETVFFDNFTEKIIQDNSITVMQFNMLADSLSRAYMPGGMEDSKAFLGVDKRCLEWRYRGLRILEEITRLSPDIICMQECDRVEFMDKYMSKLGYQYAFQDKGESAGIRTVMPSINKARSVARGSMYSTKTDSMYSNKGDNDTSNNNNNNGSNEDTNDDTDSKHNENEDIEEQVEFKSDGVIIFYKTSKFDLIDTDKCKVQKIERTSNKEGVVAVAVPLTFKGMQKDFLVVNTHLKSLKTKDGEQKREEQVESLFGDLLSNEDNLPILLCLDMNGTHTNQNYEPLCYNAMTKNLGFVSLYKDALTTGEELKNKVARGVRGEEPLFTTFKSRSTGTVKHTIDYIFDGSNTWSATKYWDIPDSAKMIPNWNYPSDHFSLCLQLTWT